MLYLLMKNARSFLEIYHCAVKLTSFFPLHQKDDLRECLCKSGPVDFA